MGMEVGNMAVECGAPAQWSGRLGFAPAHLEDQSTDEGSTHSGDISSAITTPNTTPTEAVARHGQHTWQEHGPSAYTFNEAVAWMQASEWPTSPFEGSLAEPVGSANLATSPWTTSPWAAQGTLENQIPMLNSGASFLSTAPPAYPAALPRAPSTTTMQQTPVLGTAPLGHGGTWCTFMGGPAPAPVRAPVVFAAEELAPAGPNDAPLKVSISELDLDVEAWQAYSMSVRPGMVLKMKC